MCINHTASTEPLATLMTVTLIHVCKPDMIIAFVSGHKHPFCVLVKVKFCNTLKYEKKNILAVWFRLCSNI